MMIALAVYLTGIVLSAVLVGLVAAGDVDRINAGRFLLVVFLWPLVLPMIFGAALRGDSFRHGRRRAADGLDRRD